MSSARSKNTAGSSLGHHHPVLEALAQLLARVAAQEFIAAASGIKKGRARKPSRVALGTRHAARETIAAMDAGEYNSALDRGPN